MGKIGFIIGEWFVYWSPLIQLLAAAVAVLGFLSLHLHTGGKFWRGVLLVLLAAVPSMLLGRLIYWYCRPDTFSDVFEALRGFDGSSCALAGAFAGCILAAGVGRALGLTDSFSQCMDCMALAGGAGIAVGRLNHLFNSFDRGQVVASVDFFPLVYPVENSVTGAEEYRLATFMLQAIATLILTVVLLVLFLRKAKRFPAGDICMLFLLAYGACQIFFDSTRYDKLFLRSNGFVSMVQILGAVAVVLSVVTMSVRMVRQQGFRTWYLLLWGGVLGLLTVVGIMEYFVQRRANDAAVFYGVMVLALLGVIGLGGVIHSLSLGPQRREN